MLVSLDVRGRRALVVGGGPVGRRKVSRLIQGGAEVRLVAPTDRDLEAWISEHPGFVAWRQRPFEVGDLQHCQLAFACTGSPEVNADIARAAREAGIWCNVADESHPGDFDVLATSSSGGMTIGISSSGRAPGVSRLLRTHLDALLGPQWGQLASLSEALRTRLKAEVSSPTERRDRHRALLGQPLLRALAQGEGAQIEEWTRAHLGLDIDAPVPKDLGGRRPAIVISGFGPFPGVPINPSPDVARAAAALIRARHPKAEVITVALPTHFGEAWEALRPRLETVRSDPALELVGVFPLGVAVRSGAVCLERIAINHRAGARADASGRTVSAPEGEPLIAGGPDGLFARVPVDRLALTLRGRGLRAQVSESAGTYLCNEIFYRVMVWCNEVGFTGRAGFMHIPMVPDTMSEEEAAEIVACVGENALAEIPI